MNPFELADNSGPLKVVHIHQPQANLKAIVVVDNIAAGRAIGGVRMAVDVTLSECARLARAMTLKNAAAGLPHGGGKSVIFADPSQPVQEKEQLIRAFARAIEDIRDYIVGPDMGTNEACMAWVHDEIGRAVGLPRVIGGIPLDEIGATGLGVAAAAAATEAYSGVQISGARVSVQGFGAVGKHAARFLAEKGAKLVSASDSRATVYNADGIDVSALIAHKDSGASLAEYRHAEILDRDAVIGIDCDIWIPAARPDVITIDNVSALSTKLIVQGANIPITNEAEQRLHEQGVICIPDFIANAGGVISASVEFHGGDESTAIKTIVEKVGENANEVLSMAKAENMTPRDAANKLAQVRIKAAEQTRRWHG